MQAKVGQLATKAALLHPAKRHARIAGAVTVDKDATALQLGRWVRCAHYKRQANPM